jgi:cytochrome P450
MEVNIFDPEFVRDPFPVLEAVRDRGPAVYNALTGSYLVTGYEDIARALRDHEHFSSCVLGDANVAPWFDGAATMISSDAPVAGRLRGVLRSRFTNRAVLRLEPDIRRFVREILNTAIDEKRSGGIAAFDFADSMSEQMPIRVLCEMLGIPLADADYFGKLTATLIRGTVAGSAESGEAQLKFSAALEACGELRQYVRSLLRARPRRQAPDADLLAEIIGARDVGNISEPEMVAEVLLLLIGGVDTTAKLTSGVVWLLGTDAAARARVIEAPELIPGVIEEALRLIGPATFSPRRVLGEVGISGTRLGTGDVVWLLSIAGNRDPRAFVRPNVFDISRSPNPHLSFGHGPHLCLGQNLARLELRIFLREFLARVPEYEISTPGWGETFFVRGIESMTLRANVA